jgi:signal transduction histidine kinase
MPIEAQTETRLQHGRGLGLWQLRWCVDNFDGALSFDTEAGTTVRITVPGRCESGRPDR